MFGTASKFNKLIQNSICSLCIMCSLHFCFSFRQTLHWNEIAAKCNHFGKHIVFLNGDIFGILIAVPFVFN